MHTQHLKSISKIYTRLKTHFWRDILPVTPMNVCRIKIINAILRFCFFFLRIPTSGILISQVTMHFSFRIDL